MHQIRFRLGLRPRPRWGSLQRFLRPSSWILGGPTSKGGERGGAEGTGRKGEGVGEGKGRDGEGREGRGREMDPRNFENRSTPMDAWFLI